MREKKFFLGIALSCFMPFLISAEVLRGNIQLDSHLDNNSHNKSFHIHSEKGVKIKIDANKEILKTLSSLVLDNIIKRSDKKAYVFRLEGDFVSGLRDGLTVFRLSKTPATLGGASLLRGKLVKTKNGKLKVKNTPVQFGYSKVVKGHHLDKIAQNSYLNKNLILEGDYDQNGVFVIYSLLEEELLSANASRVYPLLDEAIEKYGTQYFINEVMPQDANSQGRMPSFRTTIFEEKHHEGVRPGDAALLISLSGRQGDTFGAVNGHFAAGMGIVQDDLYLSGDMSSLYASDNDKDILSGHMSLVSYFSHITQGQSLYRPTYTLIVYGLSEEKLLRYRRETEKGLHDFRVSDMKVSGKYNCTNVAVNALKKAGIKGIYNQEDNYIKAVPGLIFKLFGEEISNLSYAAAHDSARYLPRKAFESFVKTFTSENKLKKLGVSRVDFVFQKQLPSKRPIGGAASKNVFKAKTYKKFVDLYEKEKNEDGSPNETKLSKKDLLKMLEETLPNVTND